MWRTLITITWYDSCPIGDILQVWRGYDRRKAYKVYLGGMTLSSQLRWQRLLSNMKFTVNGGEIQWHNY